MQAASTYLPLPEGTVCELLGQEVGEGKAEKFRTHWKSAYEVAQSSHFPPQGTEQ